MEMLDFLDVLIKLAVFIPLMALCVFLLGKIYGKGVGTLGKNMKVIERVQLSKENSLCLVKICNKNYVVSSSNEGIKILKELDIDVIQEMDKSSSIEVGSILKFLTGKGDRNDKQ